jgi:hypothetical protein
MVATLAHLLLWLVAAIVAIWAVSSLGVAVLAIAALSGNRRVIAQDPDAVSRSSADLTVASVTRLWGPAPAGQSRLFL